MNIRYIYSLIIAISLIFPQYSQAVTIKANLGGAELIYMINNGNNTLRSYREIYPFGYRGYISQSIEKELNLQVNGQNLQQSGSLVETGNTITIQDKPSKGSYFITGEYYDSPPMDGIEYGQRNGYQSKADIPKDEGNITLSSDNPLVISCSGRSCTTVGAGTATITINFENTKVLSQCSGARYWDNLNGINYKGFGQGNIIVSGGGIGGFSPRLNICDLNDSDTQDDELAYPYTYPAVNYSVNVKQSPALQNKPVAQYISTTEITTNRAVSKYSYSDADSDPQTGSQLEVATDIGFSNIIFSKTFTGNVNTQEVLGLKADTVYYPRVRVNNDINGWSDWAVGPEFRTAKEATSTINVTPLSAYTDADTGILSVAPKVEQGKQFRLAWGSEGTATSHECRAIGGNWIGTWVGATNGIKNEINIQQAPNTLGIHNYTLECTVSPTSPITKAITRGYSQGVESIQGNGNVYTYKMTTQIEVVASQNLPTLEFSINDKTDSLVIVSGEDLNFKWVTTNGDKFNTCTAATVSALENTMSYNVWTGDKATTGGSKRSGGPKAESDQEYEFTLTCVGAGISVSRTIKLTVKATPLISCSLDKKVIRAGDMKVKITGKLENEIGSGPYKWTLDDGNGKILNKEVANRADIVEWELDYSGLGLAKITPKIKVEDSGSPVLSTEKSCETITSFGDDTTTETNP